MSDEPRDVARELYPFLYEPTQRADAAPSALLDHVRRSTLDKCADVIALRQRMLNEYEMQLSRAAAPYRTKSAAPANPALTARSAAYRREAPALAATNDWPCSPQAKHLSQPIEQPLLILRPFEFDEGVQACRHAWYDGNAHAAGRGRHRFTLPAPDEHGARL